MVKKFGSGRKSRLATQLIQGCAQKIVGYLCECEVPNIELTEHDPRNGATRTLGDLSSSDLDSWLGSFQLTSSQSPSKSSVSTMLCRRILNLSIWKLYLLVTDPLLISDAISTLQPPYIISHMRFDAAARHCIDTMRSALTEVPDLSEHRRSLISAAKDYELLAACCRFFGFSSDIMLYVMAQIFVRLNVDARMTKTSARTASSGPKKAWRRKFDSKCMQQFVFDMYDAQFTAKFRLFGDDAAFSQELQKYFVIDSDGSATLRNDESVRDMLAEDAELRQTLYAVQDRHNLFAAAYATVPFVLRHQVANITSDVEDWLCPFDPAYVPWGSDVWERSKSTTSISLEAAAAPSRTRKRRRITAFATDTHCETPSHSIRTSAASSVVKRAVVDLTRCDTLAYDKAEADNETESRSNHDTEPSVSLNSPADASSAATTPSHRAARVTRNTTHTEQLQRALRAGRRLQRAADGDAEVDDCGPSASV